MQSVGCLFCQTRGTVSNVNQHLRNYVLAADEARTTKGCEFHNLDIIKAFMQQSSRSRTPLPGITDDRLEVLLEFAKHVTTAPMSAAESQAWRLRQYWDRDSNWWAAHVQEVDEVYVDSGRNLRKMRDKTAQIVERSVRHSLKKQWRGEEEDNVDDCAGRDYDGQTVIAGSAIGGTQVNTIRRANPGDVNQLNMQGDGARFIRREVVRPPPAPPARKKSGYRMYHFMSSDDNDNNDDDEDDDYDDDRRYIDAAGPSTAAPPQFPTKRTPAPTRLRSVPPPSYPSSSVPTRPPPSSSSISTHPPKTSILSPNTSIAEMGPFLTIDLWGIDNRRTVLPISYGTTLAGALAKACPAILKKNDIEVCFEGVEGSDWAGEWTEWRWELLMEAAEAEHIRVELRVVVVVG